MTKDWTNRRALLTALFALLVVASATFLLLPRAEAAQTNCNDGGTGALIHSWLVTPASLERDSNNVCGAGFRCEEWCSLVCGDVVPTGEFRCVPQ